MNARHSADDVGAETLLSTLRYSEIARGLFLFLITGGSERAARNLSTVFSQTGEAARDGMEAVSDLPFWRDRIKENPANRGRLLAMSAPKVKQTMLRGAGAFEPSHMIMGLSDDDLARIKAPARIIDATEPTNTMRRYNRELADRLPKADLVFDQTFQDDWSALCHQHGLGGRHYTAGASLGRLIDEFVTEREHAP